MNKQELDELCDRLRPAHERAIGRRPARRKMVIKIAGGKCQICSYPVIDIMHEHHILPLSKGGTSAIENLILLCPNCHALTHLCARCLKIDPSTESLRAILIDNGVVPGIIDSLLLVATEDAETTFSGQIVPRSNVTPTPDPSPRTDADRRADAIMDRLIGAFDAVLKPSEDTGETPCQQI